MKAKREKDCPWSITLEGEVIDRVMKAAKEQGLSIEEFVVQAIMGRGLFAALEDDCELQIGTWKKPLSREHSTYVR
jgi:hypothetical protein